MKRNGRIPGGGNCIGSVAVSTAGRDRCRVFLITGVCDEGAGVVDIADGKLRKLEKPKRKKLRHLKIVESGTDQREALVRSGTLTNRTLRALLTAYEQSDDDPSSADDDPSSADRSNVPAADQE